MQTSSSTVYRIIMPQESRIVSLPPNLAVLSEVSIHALTNFGCAVPSLLPCERNVHCSAGLDALAKPPPKPPSQKFETAIEYNLDLKGPL